MIISMSKVLRWQASNGRQSSVACGHGAASELSAQVCVSVSSIKQRGNLNIASLIGAEAVRRESCALHDSIKMAI